MFKGFGKESKQDITSNYQDKRNEAGQKNQEIAKEGTQRGNARSTSLSGGNHHKPSLEGLVVNPHRSPM